MVSSQLPHGIVQSEGRLPEASGPCGSRPNGKEAREPPFSHTRIDATHATSMQRTVEQYTQVPRSCPKKVSSTTVQRRERETVQGSLPFAVAFHASPCRALALRQRGKGSKSL